LVSSARGYTVDDLKHFIRDDCSILGIRSEEQTADSLRLVLLKRRIRIGRDKAYLLRKAIKLESKLAS
jgi:hypothetical protein